MWIKYGEEEPELYHLSANSHLMDIISIDSDMVTTIDGKMVSSELQVRFYDTTNSSPLYVIDQVSLWIEVDDDGINEYLCSPKETLRDVIGLPSDAKYIITFNGKRLHRKQVWQYEKTEKSNPIFVRTKASVWVKSSHIVPPVLNNYPLNFTIQQLDTEHNIVHQGNKILGDSKPLIALNTTRENPITFSPKEVNVEVYNEMHNLPVPKDMTFAEFIQTKFHFQSFVVSSNGQNIDPSEKLFQFIISSPLKSFSVVRQDTFKAMSLPTLETASTMSKDKNSYVYKHVVQKCIYTHWFAVEIYNKFVSEAEQRDTEIAKEVYKILSTSQGNNEVVNDEELLYTSLLSSVLDKYLFPNYEGCCLHQVSLLGGSKPDFFVSTLCNGSTGFPSLVADFKVDNYEESFFQSLAYCFHIYNQLNFVKPILVMPSTKEEFSLILCVPMPSQKDIAYIEIADKISTSDSNIMAKLFHAMSYAVQNINDADISWFDVEPFKGCRQLAKLNRRVICSTKEDRCVVLKFYDLERDSGSPNHGIISSYQRLLNSELHCLSGDERFWCLQYDYIKAKNDTIILEDLLPLISTLDSLHKDGFVHSDVRKENIVWASPAVLLDFDLCSEVGECYPDTYNHQGIEGRHPDALKNLPRYKHHDRYSLISLIINIVLLDQEKRRSLVQIRNDLESNKNTTSSLKELIF